MIWKKVKSCFSKTGENDRTGDFTGNGLVLFHVVEDAIKAEKIVKENNFECKLVAPPPENRRGCDLALEINLVEMPVIERLISPELPYVDILPVAGSSELLQIVKVSHFKEHTMVKAGNMKVTFNKHSGEIVNTSGGGCPDIPYLHLQFIGKKLSEVPRPRNISYTLCALMLDRALEECLSLWKKEEIKCCS